MITEGSRCILNTNVDDMFILTLLRPFVSCMWSIVGFHPLVDVMEGVSAITNNPSPTSRCPKAVVLAELRQSDMRAL